MKTGEIQVGIPRFEHFGVKMRSKENSPIMSPEELLRQRLMQRHREKYSLKNGA